MALRIVFLSLLFPILARAEIGMSYFAIQHPRFPCREALRVFRGVEHPALAILWGTFGEDNDCLRAWFRQSRNKPHTLEIHLTNEACVRNRRCREGEISGTRRELVKRVRSILKVLLPVKNERTRLLLSTGLEDNFSRREFRRRLKIIRSVWPYEIVRNPLYGEYFSGADLLERHGLYVPIARPCVFNFDGHNVGNGNGHGRYRPRVTRSEVRAILSRARRCDLAFLWEANSQGLYGGKNFTDPRARSFGISAGDVRHLNELMR